MNDNIIQIDWETAESKVLIEQFIMPRIYQKTKAFNRRFDEWEKRFKTMFCLDEVEIPNNYGRPMIATKQDFEQALHSLPVFKRAYIKPKKDLFVEVVIPVESRFLRNLVLRAYMNLYIKVMLDYMPITTVPFLNIIFVGIE